MPREVREAVAWCMSSDASPAVAKEARPNGDAEGLSEEEAKEYVERMFDQGRGGEESW